MEFGELVEKRFSCKKFSDKEPETGKIMRMLQAGRLAPTAKNLQEQRLYVIRSAEKLSVIDGITPCRYGAPVVIVVAYDSGNVFTYPGGTRDSGTEDAVIVATHMLLSAADEGLDSCWINFFDPEKAAAALGLPENERIVMLLDVGYAAEGAKPLANHYNRKPLEETVKFI